MKNYLGLLLTIIVVGCGTIKAVPPTPALIPETSLVKCDPLPRFSEYSNGSTLIKDQLNYTIHLMNIYTDCATSKDTLINDVRVTQPSN